MTRPVTPLRLSSIHGAPSPPRTNDGAFAKPMGGIENRVGAPPPATAIDPIAHYIDLEIEARQCVDLDALRFAIVNSTRRLLGFEQAFLVEPAVAAGWQVTRAASVSSIDANAPAILALQSWLGSPQGAQVLSGGELRQYNLKEEASRSGFPADALSAHALWLPLRSRTGHIPAALVACGLKPWPVHQTVLLTPLAGAYAHAWAALQPKGRGKVSRASDRAPRKLLAVAVGLAAGLTAFAPVPISALAPSEIVAAEPVLVTAPIDGVLGEILAPPGAWLEKGAPVLRFVDIKQRNDLEIARRNVAVAEARHFKIVQTATALQKDAQDMASAEAELEVARAEHAYAVDVLAKTEVRALAAGLLIYSAKSDWIGKPVATGERIMEIGDPHNLEVRIELPVADAIALELGARVAMFLDGDPLRSIAGRVTRISYRPVQSAGQQLVFRIFARLDGNDAGRIGTRGIARVSGRDVPLWFFLFRRPIAAVRQWVGL